MNIDAAERGLDHYNQAREGGKLGELVDTLEADLIDLITDLLHLAHRRDEDAHLILRMAEMHFKDEEDEK